MTFDRLELVRIKNALWADIERREEMAKALGSDAICERNPESRRIAQRIEAHLAKGE